MMEKIEVQASKNQEKVTQIFHFLRSVKNHIFETEYVAAGC